VRFARIPGKYSSLASRIFLPAAAAAAISLFGGWAHVDSASDDGGESAPAAEYRFEMSAPAQQRSPAFSIFQKGEELTYEVSYLTIKLGTIISRVVSIDTVKGKVFYRAECVMRTYKGVPLVSLWTRFQSTIDDRFGCVSFSAKEKIKDTLNKYINYTFPKNRDVVYVSERIGNKPVPRNYDTLKLEGKSWQDGLSLLFYARAFATQRFTSHVPVLIYRSRATTKIDFGVAGEEMEIDAVKYPINTVKLEGETGFTGILGLTGGFEGWFSKDAAAVPIYAKMHVIIGSVAVELIGWKRPGWTPPPYRK
jgi:hypothetical protein